MKSMRKVWALLVPLLAIAGTARAQNEYASDPFDPIIARDSWQLISQAEKAYQIPPGLLHAMSLVETGQGIRGWVLPWPYTVGVNSPGSQSYTGRAAALTALNRYRSMGFVRYDLRLPGVKRQNVTAAEAQNLLLAAPEVTVAQLTARNYGRRFKNGAEAEAFVKRMFAMGYRNLDLGMMQVNWKVHGKHFANIASAFDPTLNLDYAVRYLLEHRETRDWWGSVGRYHSGTPYYANSYVRNVYNMYLRIHRVNNNA